MSTAPITENGGQLPSHMRKGHKRRKYTELDRITGLMLASLIGATEAAEELGFPRRTMYLWAEQIGGIAQLKEQSRSMLAQTMYATALEACRQLRIKFATMDGSQLTAALQALSVGVLSTPESQLAQSGAQPANVVQILIGDKDHREVIEVARSNPDPNQQQ